MSQQQVAEVISPPFDAQSLDTALSRVSRAFEKTEPLAFLQGSTGSSTDEILSRFTSGLNSDVTVIRVNPPYANDISLLRAVIHGIGFKSKGLSLLDLENVFTMFLSFQKGHQLRTVLCLQGTENCESWLLQRIQWFVRLEVGEQSGLMTLVTGRQSLAADEVIDHSFSLADTRQYVRSQVESTESSDIAQLFEFEAITLIHELSGGVEEKVSELYSRCLQLADESATRPITELMVRAAHERINKTPHVTDAKHITVRRQGEPARHLPLDGGHILIGRDELCDVRVSSRAVSRHHALIVKSDNGITIIDLGSTNGTFVDGQRICQFELQNSGVITVGDCGMEYIASSGQEPYRFDLEGANDAESVDPHHETQTLQCNIKGNINAKGEKIYHVMGSALYNKTQIDESKGERWFHSEEEALAAGWRKSRR